MTTQELNDWFEQSAKIITDLHICLNNANRLFDFKYENEEWIKKHGFFRHHYYQRFGLLCQYNLPNFYLIAEIRNITSIGY
jgi:hypothetical protein